MSAQKRSMNERFFLVTDLRHYQKLWIWQVILIKGDYLWRIYGLMIQILSSRNDCVCQLLYF